LMPLAACVNQDTASSQFSCSSNAVNFLLN
jgi:hypothetical protein